MRYALYVMRYALYVIRYTLYVIRYTLYVIRYKLYVIRYMLYAIYRDYFMVGECVRFLFTSCEGLLNERVSLATFTTSE